MKNKRWAIKLILFTAVILTATMAMTSCLWVRGSAYMTRDEVDKLIDGALDGKLGGEVVIENAPNYNITIENNGNPNLVAAAKSVLSAVRITANFETSYVHSSTSKQYSSGGAGVIYKLDKKSGDAYVITNYHVIYDSKANTKNHISDDISLYLYGQESPTYAIPAKYVGGSMSMDLAVLKVERSAVLAASNAAAVTVADSNEVSILDTAIAIGNPASGGLSATVGCINVDSEYIEITGADGISTVELRLFRIDTAVNNGNSGGGLFNDRGELIGIVNAKMSSSTVDNIGYAIPSNIAKYVSDNIIHYCDGTALENPYKYKFGITVESSELYTVYDEDTGKVHKRETVKVADIIAGSVGAEVFKLGDVIKAITVDGVRYEINRSFVLIDCMYNIYSDSTVTVEVERDGEKVTLTPVFESRTADKVS